jgi:hypothetical protein
MAERTDTMYKRLWVPMKAFIDWLDTGKLALAAVIWYGFLWISYNRFYEPLGISPNDVGLNYATILANSVGAAVAFLIPFLLAITSFLYLAVTSRVLAWFMSRGNRARPPNSASASLFNIRNASSAIAVTVLASTGFLVYLFPVRASIEAQRAKHGRGASPLYTLGAPAPVLTIRADPVISIQSTAVKKAGESVAVESLSSNGLLYMGQANSVIVLYDSLKRRAVYLPASSVVLTVDTE